MNHRKWIVVMVSMAEMYVESFDKYEDAKDFYDKEDGAILAEVKESR